MELNFYSLSVLYQVYSFLGWVGETVVATIKGRRFANRGVASGPFCFIYGFTAVLLAISFADRPSPLLLFLGCAIDATVVEWLTAKLLERVNRRRWWDYSGKRFNVDGYICLQYSLLWGALGTATVLWGNGLLFKLYGLLPQWQGRDQGIQPLGQIIQRCRHMGLLRLRLRCGDDRQRSFWEKLGFSQVGGRRYGEEHHATGAGRPYPPVRGGKEKVTHAWHGIFASEPGGDAPAGLVLL